MREEIVEPFAVPDERPVLVRNSSTSGFSSLDRMIGAEGNDVTVDQVRGSGRPQLYANEDAIPPDETVTIRLRATSPAPEPESGPGGDDVLARS